MAMTVCKYCNFLYMANIQQDRPIPLWRRLEIGMKPTGSMPTRFRLREIAFVLCFGIILCLQALTNVQCKVLRLNTK